MIVNHGVGVDPKRVSDAGCVLNASKGENAIQQAQPHSARSSDTTGSSKDSSPSEKSCGTTGSDRSNSKLLTISSDEFADCDDVEYFENKTLFIGDLPKVFQLKDLNRLLYSIGEVGANVLSARVKPACSVGVIDSLLTSADVFRSSRIPMVQTVLRLFASFLRPSRRIHCVSYVLLRSPPSSLLGFALTGPS
jgi:hypothetical protein